MLKKSISGITINDVPIETYLTDSDEAEDDRRRLVADGSDKSFLYRKPRQRPVVPLSDRRPSKVKRMQQEINLNNRTSELHRIFNAYSKFQMDIITMVRQCIVVTLMCSREERLGLKDVSKIILNELKPLGFDLTLKEMGYRLRGNIGKLWTTELDKHIIVHERTPKSTSVTYEADEELKNMTFADALTLLDSECPKAPKVKKKKPTDSTKDIMGPPVDPTPKDKKKDQSSNITITGPIHLHFHINFTLSGSLENS